MKENILFSVIVPIYNVEIYLERCIQSILNQTYTNFELILVDDGSPDLCPEICDQWAKNDNRIKVIHKNNEGLSSARNEGLDIAKGEYIVFVDSDDYVSSVLLEVAKYIIMKSDCEMVVYGYTSTENELVADNSCNVSYNLLSTNEAYKLYEKSVISRMSWDKIYKANLFTDKRYPKGMLAEDYALTCKLIADSKRISLTNKKMYFYTKRPDSITGVSIGNMKLVNDNYIIGKNNYVFSTIRFPSLHKYITDEYVKLLICTIIKLRILGMSESSQMLKDIEEDIKKLAFSPTTLRTKVMHLLYILFPNAAESILKRHILRS